MSAASSKRKRPAAVEAEDDLAPPKILMSCDACRARKVKCDLSDRPRQGQESCSHCIGLDIACVFSERKKRRGPPNQYLLRLQRDRQEGQTAGDSAPSTVPPQTVRQNTSTDNPPLVVDGAFDPTSRVPQHIHNPNNVLDNLIPRGLLLAIVGQYFDYVYPLEPLVHRPTFLYGLQTFREEQTGQDEWVALVLSVVGTTLCKMQALKELMPKSEAQILVQKCYHLIRGFLSRDHDFLSLERSIILLFFASISASLGRRMVSTAARGAFTGMMIRQGLHLNATYDQMPVLERELRRRVYWMTYGGDVTLCTLEDIPPMMNVDICGSVALPSAIDDDAIAYNAYLPTGNECSLLHGFVYVSQIFKLLGRVLELRRRDRRNVPSGSQVDLRLLELDELAEDIANVMRNCPLQLHMEVSDSDSPFDHFLGDFRATIAADMPKRQAEDAFLVQQANIYVTQQLARFVLASYRADLAQMSDTPNIDPRRSGFAIVPQTFSRERKNKVARDLLSMLKKIPTHLIAINARPLINKVRYVACTLLDVGSDELQASAVSLGGDDDAQRDLIEFLRILGELEEFSKMDPVPL